MEKFPANTASVPASQESALRSFFVRLLGPLVRQPQREDDKAVSNGEGEQAASTGITLEDVQAELNRVDEERRNRTPDWMPQPLELGPQRYPDPRLWGPENGTEDESYRDSLKLLPNFEPAHVSAKRNR